MSVGTRTEIYAHLAPNEVSEEAVQVLNRSNACNRHQSKAQRQARRAAGETISLPYLGS